MSCYVPCPAIFTDIGTGTGLPPSLLVPLKPYHLSEHDGMVTLYAFVQLMLVINDYDCVMADINCMQEGHHVEEVQVSVQP